MPTSTMSVVRVFLIVGLGVIVRNRGSLVWVDRVVLFVVTVVKRIQIQQTKTGYVLRHAVLSDSFSRSGNPTPGSTFRPAALAIVAGS